MKDAADEFERVCERETIHTSSDSAASIIYSSISTRPIPGASLAPKDLANLICRQKANHHGMVNQVSQDVSKILEKDQTRHGFTVLNIGPGGRLGHSLTKSLVSGSIFSDRVKLQDLEEQSMTRANLIKTTGQSSATVEEEIAIVGLAYRFPGKVECSKDLSNLFRSAPDSLIEKVRYMVSSQFLTLC
jgi:hypothetical protein